MYGQRALRPVEELDTDLMAQNAKCDYFVGTLPPCTLAAAVMFLIPVLCLQ